MNATDETDLLYLCIEQHGMPSGECSDHSATLTGYLIMTMQWGN